MTGFAQPGAISGAANGDLSGSYPAPTVTKINGLGQRPAYTQTYAPSVRAHALGALSTAVVVGLLTDVPGLFNTTNATVNELKQIVNQIIDDLQAFGLAG